jgi:beta-glucosidase
VGTHFRSIRILIAFIFSSFVFSSAFGSNDFGNNFWWGVGHSAFQVEGNPEDSDWKRWTEESGRITDGTNANVATQFWNNPEPDFEQAKELGSNMFRMSIAWERIHLGPGQWNEEALNRYEQIIIQMRKRGLEPMITLQHFVLPQWIAKEGGLTSKVFVDQFTEYAIKVVQKLALGPAQVKWWMTFNEPMVLVTGGYILGEWPPGKKNLSEAFTAAQGMIKAHKKAMLALRSRVDFPKDLKFSIAMHYRDVEAKNFGPLNSLVADSLEWALNRWFLDQINAKTLDYLGINYYGRTVIELQAKIPPIAFTEGEGPKSDIGWVLHPKGLGKVLRDAHRYYKVPILVAENGLADANDTQRVKFIKDHLDEIKKAKKEGVNVFGYLHWSLTDNFEWAKGLAPRFGLISINFDNGVRTPRPSFYVYKQIISEESSQ